MPRSKRKTSKKRKRRISREKNPTDIPNSPLDEEFNSLKPIQCEVDLYRDNISIYEREKGHNPSALDTVDGIEYDVEDFRRQYPNLAEELADHDLTYPIDAVRWNDEERIEEELPRPEEPTVESLLRRSRTEKEAKEIINYLEKRGEISSREAKTLLSIIKTRGLKAFK